MLPPIAPDFRSFAAIYQRRRTDVADDRGDPAIRADLEILTALGRRGRALPELEIERQLQFYRYAIGSKPEGAADEFDSIDVNITRHGGYRFIVARMGAVTQSTLLDPQGQKVALPDSLVWNHPFMPRPIWLSKHLLLLDEESLQAAGMQGRERVVWIRIDGSQGRIVGQTTGWINLDQFGVKVRGAIVRLDTDDVPRYFQVYPPDSTFRHRRLWNCSSGFPRLVKSMTHHKGLRFVDGLLADAYASKQPSKLEKWMLEFGGSQTLDWWSEVQVGGELIVTLDDTQYTLRPRGGGFKLLKVLDLLAPVWVRQPGEDIPRRGGPRFSPRGSFASGARPSRSRSLPSRARKHRKLLRG